MDIHKDIHIDIHIDIHMHMHMAMDVDTPRLALAALCSRASRAWQEAQGKMGLRGDGVESRCGGGKIERE